MYRISATKNALSVYFSGRTACVHSVFEKASESAPSAAKDLWPSTRLAVPNTRGTQSAAQSAQSTLIRQATLPTGKIRSHRRPKIGKRGYPVGWANPSVAEMACNSYPSRVPTAGVRVAR